MAPTSSPSYLPSIFESSTLIAKRLIHSSRNVAPSSLPPSSTSIATRSLKLFTESTASLLRRQSIVVIPSTYANQNSGPTPGAVVGIILGSVVGFLLLLWLIYTCFNLGPRGGTTIVEEEVIRRRSRSPRRAPSRRSSPRRSVSRSEIIEVSRHRSPVPPPRSPPRREVRRESIVIEETRRPAPREDDIVEVIEEHSPPPPRRQRSHRASGYRTVDPEAFGGGDRPLRPVSRSRSRR